MAKNHSNASGRNLFGNAHSSHPSVGAGKGSAPRYKLNDEFRSRYDGIDFSGPQVGFERVGVKEIKRYGAADPGKTKIEMFHFDKPNPDYV